MITENILDQTQPQNNQFINCKIRYLIAQNKLMTLQYNSISTLVQKYKNIIDILSKPENQTIIANLQIQNRTSLPQSSQQNQRSKIETQNQQQLNREINKVLSEAQLVIHNCIKECRQISNSKDIFPEDEQTITPAFFSQLVLSYQKSIAQLKHSIHQRQILLQDLQSNPSHPLKRRQDQSQSTAIIKAIESYDIYPKISQKCRKHILQLKHKKRQLEYENSSKISNSSSIHKSKKMSSSTNSSQIDKTVKKVSQYSANNHSEVQNTRQFQTQTMSPFQKTILIYKKKKIFNDILQAKVISLKKKIKQKQQCNKILKRRLENQVWDNIENINHYPKNLDEDDPAYLSMLNQSLNANNLDFSVDISRVLTGVVPKNEPNLNLNNILQQVNEQTQRQGQNT